jgi:hypothetical protein
MQMALLGTMCWEAEKWSRCKVQIGLPIQLLISIDWGTSRIASAMTFDLTVWDQNRVPPKYEASVLTNTLQRLIIARRLSCDPFSPEKSYHNITEESNLDSRRCEDLKSTLTFCTSLSTNYMCMKTKFSPTFVNSTVGLDGIIITLTSPSAFNQSG